MAASVKGMGEILKVKTTMENDYAQEFLEIFKLQKQKVRSPFQQDYGVQIIQSDQSASKNYWSIHSSLT